MKLKVEERSYVEAKLKPPKEIWAVKRCNEGITIKKMLDIITFITTCEADTSSTPWSFNSGHSH